MRPISFRRNAVVLSLCFWVATIAGADFDQAQPSTPQEDSSPAQSQVPAAPRTPRKKPAKSGVWHHFGESGNASVRGQNKSGGWRPFSPNGAAPKVAPSKSSQPISGGRIVESVPQPRNSSNRMADLEMQMWAMVNRNRLDSANADETKGGHALRLRWNERLAEVARAHSRDMLEQRFFDHIDPEGRTPAARINAGGIPWRALGENIAINGTVPGAEAAFMDEPRFENNHRANILNTKYTDVGIGIMQAPNGSLYITQDFVTIPPGPLVTGKDSGAR